MAGAALDMSVDDLIKNKKKSRGRRCRGRGRASGPGPARRVNNRGANRATPYGGPKAPDAAWRHGMFGVPDQSMGNGGPGGRPSAIETRTKIYVSNLDYGVSNEDIKELFSEVGDLKKYCIHYDRRGKFKGTAEIVYSRRQDALAAVQRYNNVQLDGRPMKIEMVGINLVAPGGSLPLANNSIGNMNGYPRSGQDILYLSSSRTLSSSQVASADEVQKLKEQLVESQDRERAREVEMKIMLQQLTFLTKAWKDNFPPPPN